MKLFGVESLSAFIIITQVRVVYGLNLFGWQDYLGRESLLIEEDDLETKPNQKMKLYGVYKKAIFGVSCGKKFTFCEDDS